MAEPPLKETALRSIVARRIATDCSSAETLEEVRVVVEAAVTIDVDRVESYTLLCTPHETLALAAGFILSEGLVDGAEDIVSIQPCASDPSTIRVKLREGGRRIGDAGRNLLISSSCGLCGVENIANKLRALPAVGDRLRIDCRVLQAMDRAVREQQVLFQACGGTHAVGIFDGRGQLLVVAEDTGRHNALDKAIGKSLLGGIPVAGCGVVLSGRASLEIVGKCARAGIELVSAISAPTSLAVEVAERCNITLCAFVRESRATVLSHPRRVLVGR